MKRDVSIQCIRILAMLFIVLCHLASGINNAIIRQTSQLFNVGVPIFLFLSGWLYSCKDIMDVQKWYLNKVKRILIPMWIFVVILFIITLIIEKQVEFRKIFVYLTNTQYFFGGITGGEHLWFISIIFLCYLITPLLPRIKRYTYVVVATIIIGCALCFISQMTGRVVLYFSIYLLGYSLGVAKIEIKPQIDVLLLQLG